MLRWTSTSAGARQLDHHSFGNCCPGICQAETFLCVIPGRRCCSTSTTVRLSCDHRLAGYCVSMSIKSKMYISTIYYIYRIYSVWRMQKIKDACLLCLVWYMRASLASFFKSAVVWLDKNYGKVLMQMHLDKLFDQSGFLGWFDWSRWSRWSSWSRWSMWSRLSRWSGWSRCSRWSGWSGGQGG